MSMRGVVRVLRIGGSGIFVILILLFEICQDNSKCLSPHLVYFPFRFIVVSCNKFIHLYMSSNKGMWKNIL